MNERKARKWPHNKMVASLLGVTHSHVSMLRSGHRSPSYHVMLKIEQVYEWPVIEQLELARKGTEAGGYPDFAKAFEAKLQAKHPPVPAYPRPREDQTA